MLSSRERELLALQTLNGNGTISGSSLCDVSQSFGRTTPRSGYAPCITPHAKLWHYERKRVLLGVEKLALQGLVFWEKSEEICNMSDELVSAPWRLRPVIFSLRYHGIGITESRYR